MWSQRNLLSFLTTSRNAVHGKGGCLAPDDPRTARRSGHQSCRRLSSMCILESDYCTSATQDGDRADCAKNVAPPFVISAMVFASGRINGIAALMTYRGGSEPRPRGWQSVADRLQWSITPPNDDLLTPWSVMLCYGYLTGECGG